MGVYLSFDSLLKMHKAFAIIGTGELDNLKCGRYELEDGIYVNIMEYDTKINGDFESHHKYADIHYVIHGTERMLITSEENLTITREYEKENDFLLGKAEGISYILSEKQPFIVMPGEAHLPGLSNGDDRIKKAVVKVPIIL